MQNTSNTSFALKPMASQMAAPTPVTTNPTHNTQTQPHLAPPANESAMEKSSLVSRNVTVSGHRTSVRLEPDMWNALRDICRREHLTIHDISTAISIHKPSNSSLTAAIRVFVMAYYRAASTEDGHSKAGHGPGGFFMTNWGLQKQPHPTMMSPMSAQNRMNTVMRRF